MLVPAVVLAGLQSCRDDLPPGLGEDLGFSALLFVQRGSPPNSGGLLFPERFSPGGNLCVLRPPAPGGGIIQLTGLAAGDVQGFDVSPDGGSAVTSVKTAEFDRYHLLVVELGPAQAGQPCFLPEGDLGPACRMLTFGPADDVQPFYLPDGRIAFSRMDPDGPVDFQGRGRARSLFAIEPDGGSVIPLDFEIGAVLGASLLQDGRIQAVRWMEMGGAPVFRPVRLDPSGVSGVVPDGPVIGEEGVPLFPVADRGKRLYAACIPPLLTWGAGTICQRNDQGIWKGVLGGIPSGDGCSPEGRLRDPLPLADGRFLVGYAMVPDGCLTAADELKRKTPDFGLAVLEPRSGARYPLYNTLGMDDFWPKPLSERSLLAPGAVLPTRPEGTCDRSGVVFEGWVDGEALARGAVRLRVLQGLSGALAPWAMEIGPGSAGAQCGGDSNEDSVVDAYEAPVFSDGSFRLRAPFGVPLRLQVLDHYGAAIRSDPLWRGGPDCSVRRCGSCHVNDSQAAGFSDSQAAAREAFPLVSPKGVRSQDSLRSFDFRRELQPILDRSCATAKCHDAETRAGNTVTFAGALVGLVLTGEPSGRTTAAFENLIQVDVVRDAETGEILRQNALYVVPGQARDSRLVQRLGVPCRHDCLGQPGWANWGVSGGRCHPEDVGGVLSDEERWLMVDWIDAGAPFYGLGATP